MELEAPLSSTILSHNNQKRIQRRHFLVLSFFFTIDVDADIPYCHRHPFFSRFLGGAKKDVLRYGMVSEGKKKGMEEQTHLSLDLPFRPGLVFGFFFSSQLSRGTEEKPPFLHFGKKKERIFSFILNHHHGNLCQSFTSEIFFFPISLYISGCWCMRVCVCVRRCVDVVGRS